MDNYFFHKLLIISICWAVAYLGPLLDLIILISINTGSKKDVGGGKQEQES